MNALILEEPGRLRLTEIPEPAGPGPGEALVRVHRTGVCGTDLHAFRGVQPFFTYPRLIGHELGVEVLEVGEGVIDVTPGERCAVEPYINCGHCIACRRGKGNCCARLKVLGVHTDGGLRERFLVPAHKLHRSSILSYEQLALVETLGIGAHAVQRAHLETGEWALVVGCGPIGLGVLQFAKQAGARAIALDANDERLAFCRRKWGVGHTVRAGESALGDLRDLTDGDLPTAVFDATGNPASMRAAFDYAAPGGRLVYVGLFQGDATFHDPDFHRKELTLSATRNSTPRDFRDIIGWMENGDIDTSAWITHRVPLAEAADQFPGWTSNPAGLLKAVIEL